MCLNLIASLAVLVLTTAIVYVDDRGDDNNNNYPFDIYYGILAED